MNSNRKASLPLHSQGPSWEHCPAIVVVEKVPTIPVGSHTKMKKNYHEHLEPIVTLIAGHLKELKQRGLLDETLVVWRFNSRDYCLNIISLHNQTFEDVIFLFDRNAVIIIPRAGVTVFSE